MEKAIQFYPNVKLMQLAPGCSRGGPPKGETIEAPIERVKGGLFVTLESCGFVPASHVDRRFVDNLEQFIGQVWKLKVLR